MISKHPSWFVVATNGELLLCAESKPVKNRRNPQAFIFNSLTDDESDIMPLQVLLKWGDFIPAPDAKPLSRFLKSFTDTIVDESFALRLKRGGPKWERQTNQYEMALRSEYQAWADATAAQLAETETPEEFDRVLDDRIDELVALLVLLGRRNLPEAHRLGLGGQLATPDGMGELAVAMGENEGYIRDKLGPAVADKMRQRVAEEPAIREDRDSLAAVLGTFLARAGSYAGAYWGLTQLGLADRTRQAAEQLKQRLIREEELTPVEAEQEAKIPVRWFLDPTVKVHCGTCLAFGNRTYASWDDMLAETGGIYPANGTDCDGNCRCSCSAGVDGEWRRVWTHLAEPGGGLPLTER